MTERPSVQSVDLQRPPSRAGAWLRRHPVAIDIAVVVIACGPYLLALIVQAGGVGWWGYPLLGITAAALLLRRRRPFPVLAIVAIACAASPLAQPGFGYPMVPFSFALFTVASRQSASRALIGYGVGVGVSVLATIPCSLSGITPPLVTLLDPFSLIALVAGLIVRNRREQRQRLVELVNERIENAALTERTRIAAEMHDIVAHALTVIVTLAGGAASIRGKHPEKADAAVEQIAAVGRDALSDMNRTLHLLGSADPEPDADPHRSGDPLPTLDELAERFRASGLPVFLSRRGAPLPEEPAVQMAVFRIVQESLTNTLRHAIEPTQARVIIFHDACRIEIAVEDDGQLGRGRGEHGPVPRGPDEHGRVGTRPFTSGHGLIGIKQRAAAHGGHARSAPNPGGGWRTHVVLHSLGRGARGD